MDARLGAEATTTRVPAPTRCEWKIWGPARPARPEPSVKEAARSMAFGARRAPLDAPRAQPGPAIPSRSRRRRVLRSFPEGQRRRRQAEPHDGLSSATSQCISPDRLTCRTVGLAGGKLCCHRRRRQAMFTDADVEDRSFTDDAQPCGVAPRSRHPDLRLPNASFVSAGHRSPAGSSRARWATTRSLTQASLTSEGRLAQLRGRAGSAWADC